MVEESGYAERREAFEALAREQGMAFMVVDRGLAGLQALAAWYLDGFPRLLRIGITGSSGKTTVKEMVAAILSRSMNLAMNEGNLNSETGLPLSVFNVDGSHAAGVFEMGMNRRGEIAELAGVLRPSLALITNVGTAHIGILGSQAEIAKEKKEIFSRFGGSELGFVDEDEAYGAFLREGVAGRIESFGPRSTRGYRGSVSLGLDGTAVDWEGSRFTLPLPGAHNLRNALGAISLALAAGARPEDVPAGLGSIKPLFGRGEILRGRVTVIRDCYNANPESALAAIDFCDSVEWPGGRRVYALGSMLELGAGAEEAHAALGRALAASKADAVLLFGAETRAALEAARRAGYRGDIFQTEDPAEMAAAVEARLGSGDLLLLKGSRGMRMERFAEGVLGGGADDAAAREESAC
jgi:UDP-N-acetylmuramoyl-tripeptide--D-alanyl-D-alanine ligase